MSGPFLSPLKVLICLSGSISAYKAASLASALKKKGCLVRTASTESALQFIGPATLEGITGEPVLTGMFNPGHEIPHIHLAEWADLIVLYPASAAALARMRTGLAEDLVSAIFLANNFRRPYWICPAMNSNMLAHPAVQENLNALGGWGAKIVEGEHGMLACGTEGRGRAVEPLPLAEMIFSALGDDGGDSGQPGSICVQESNQYTSFDTEGASTSQVSQVSPGLCKSPPIPRLMNTLITSGGTEEPIDGIRSISNTSTGQTGAALARFMAARGWNITLLRSRRSVPPPPGIRHEEFTSFKDLDSLLQNQLKSGHFHAVIHLAAVGDFSVASVETEDGQKAGPSPAGKIPSETNLVVRLHKNPKILEQLKNYAPETNPPVVVGFKLTRGASNRDAQQAVSKMFQDNHVDFVVHNDMQSITPAAHPATIHSRRGHILYRTETKEELARHLTVLLESEKQEQGA